MTAQLNITAAGRAALANTANIAMGQVTITHLAIGSGLKQSGDNDDARTALRSEQNRVAATGAVSNTGNRVAVRGDVTPSAAFSVTELGLFANDPEGNSVLLAYWAGESAADAIAAAASGAMLVMIAALEIVNAVADVTITNNANVTLNVAAGGIIGETAVKAADYTVVAGDNGKTTEVNASAAARTVNLPDLGAGDDGFTHTVIKTDSSANAVTIDGNGSDTINGTATYVLEDQWESVILKWTGSAWLAIGGASTGWLRDFFGGASHRDFATAGAHNYSWEWNVEKGLAVIVPGLQASEQRESARDINFGAVTALGAASDGTTLWFVQQASNVSTARAYVAATRARDSAKDIVLGTGSSYGGASDGTTLWFVDVVAGSYIAKAYVAATRAADTAKDINLGSKQVWGGTSDGTTLWFVEEVNSNLFIARAYTAATRARDSTKDITLPGDTFRYAASDGATLWFFQDLGQEGRAVAFRASDRSRQTDKDVSTDFRARYGGVSDGTTLWVVDAAGASDKAKAYRAPVDGEASSVAVAGSTYSADPGGQPVAQELTGLSTASALAITVGDGATAGRVLLIPLY